MGDDGPFGSRTEARFRYASRIRAGRSGVLGSTRDLNRAALVDVLELAGVDLGQFDLEVIGQAIIMLDDVALAVLVSLLERAAGAPPVP